ncbi:CGNR zinc finger domain-containing protein [Paraburkholderia sp. SIMBA_054]|uniref:CGNR zinc finger domain-containing protein n=1 Tax=Paraburkholderia sp. SIMBA_054 TaxID=3085795 RepID=UPI00397862A1
MLKPDFLTLADDPVLDFLNTIAQGENGLYEYLETDKDVVDWLRTMGVRGDDIASDFKRGSLANAARRLRDVIRELVSQKKSGNLVNIAALNSFLTRGRYHVFLTRRVDGHLEVRHEYEKNTPEQVLTPVSEAAAQLLVNGDFDLIRKCEAADCVLWFYDRTKAHRRRWCSMAMCGNRRKAANFRIRQRQVERCD